MGHMYKKGKNMLFSIVIVSLNPGDKLKKTVDSVIQQSCQDVQILVKDGMSRDGSVEALEKIYGGHPKLEIVRKSDGSIYEGMNQAVELVKGEYVLFLNCGDTFYDNEVLKRTAEIIRKRRQKELPAIFYGDTYCEKTQAAVHSAPEITGFTCYRNIPCHQSCFYDRRLFMAHPYETAFRIRADYEHFLWCYYEAHAEMIYMDELVSSYEGGGYSESKENRRRDKEEHKKITKRYMSSLELWKYRLIMAASLAPLRRALAENRLTGSVYNWLKTKVYQRRTGKEA